MICLHKFYNLHFAFFCEMKALYTNFLFIFIVDVDQKLMAPFLRAWLWKKGKGWLDKKGKSTRE